METQNYRTQTGKMSKKTSIIIKNIKTMKNLSLLFFAAIILFASCTTTEEVIIENENPKVVIPFDPENENDLPNGDGGFIISVGDGFGIGIDTIINDLPTDINGFNTISDFETYQSEMALGVKFNAVDNLTDVYTFMIYDFEAQEVLTGFRIRGGATSYNYEVHNLPTEKDLIIWGWINRGFGQEYLGGSWVNLNSNN